MRDLVKRRKSEVRYCKWLSNGQLLNVYFWRQHGIIQGENIMIWHVGVIISRDRKQANAWYNNGKNHLDHRSTGECGMEGLRQAAAIICSFRDNMKGNEMLFVGFEDAKRKSAYRYLARYGFKEYWEGENMKFYASPNLTTRIWIQE